MELRQHVLPLANAYMFNEDRIMAIIKQMKTKLKLDEKLEIVNKQLDIWHNRYSNSEMGLDKQKRKDLEATLQLNEKIIAEFEKNEQKDFEFNEANDEKIAQSSWYHRLFVSIHIWLRKNTHDFFFTNN